MTKNVAATAGLSDRRVFAVLKDLALDLSWSWNHYAHLLWKQLDPELWERTRNPLLVLQTVSRERLLQVAATTNSKSVCAMWCSRERRNTSSSSCG